MNLVERIILEWSYKTRKGYPDIKNEEDMRIFESMFGFNIKEGILEKSIRKELINKNPGFFEAQSADSRIANLKKISAEEFVDKINSTFNIDNVTVYPPNSGPNKKSITSAASSKFNMFEFEVDGKQVRLLLSGGASANAGQEFEDRIYIELKEAAGMSISEIENPQIVQLLKFLKVDPLKYSAEDVIQTGGVDTKRPLDLEKGAQDMGPTISDVELTANGTTHYLSIKNKKGDNIYNGGNVSAIKFNSDKTKIILDPAAYQADSTKVQIFDMFNIDPEKVVEGLNNYIQQQGEETGYESVDFDKARVSKMIGSAVDYGYVYVREETNSTLKLINIATAEDTVKFVGQPTAVKIKYPSKSSKTTNVAIDLSGSTAGYTKVLIEIRNAQGGIERPSIKAKIL
jgi:hypothetical protein